MIYLILLEIFDLVVRWKTFEQFLVGDLTRFFYLICTASFRRTLWWLVKSQNKIFVLFGGVFKINYSAKQYTHQAIRTRYWPWLRQLLCPTDSTELPLVSEHNFKTPASFWCYVNIQPKSVFNFCAALAFVIGVTWLGFGVMSKYWWN
jgi:hypothetical protein